MSQGCAAEWTFRLFIAPFHNATPTNRAMSNTQNTNTHMHIFFRVSRVSTNRIHDHKVWLLGVGDYSGRACIC